MDFRFRLSVFLLFIFSLILILPQAVSATANTVGANWTAEGGENCTTVVLSSVQKTANPIVASKFQWNVTLNITNTGLTDKTCEVNYTGYTYGATGATDVVVYDSTGTPIADVTAGTDGASRRKWNFTSESVTAESSTYEQIIFNFSTSITSQTTQTARLVGQSLISMANNGENTITNLNSTAFTYDSGWEDTNYPITVWDCATDSICGDQWGSKSGKTNATANSTINTTANTAQWKDHSVPVGTNYYAVEGSLSGGYEYPETSPSGGIISGVTGQPYSQIQAGKSIWGFVLILLAIVFVIAVCAIIYYAKKG